MPKNRSREFLQHERNAIYKKYGMLLEDISEILFNADPCGISHLTNTHEYESEASTILPRLEFTRSVKDVQTVVYEEFSRWFYPVEIGSFQKFEDIAENIWAIWSKYKSTVS
jgi:hypothetical protein